MAGWLDIATPFVADHEGFRPKVYRDPVGVETVGYGETDPALIARYRGGITEPAARRLLRRRLADFGGRLDHQVTVPLTGHQRAALTSWAYNVGLAATGSSTLVRRLNDGEYGAVPVELMRWTKGGGRELEGLVNRRRAEGALWKSGGPRLSDREQRIVGRLEFHKRRAAGLQGLGRARHRGWVVFWRVRARAQMRRLRRAADRGGWGLHQRGARYQVLNRAVAR